MVLFSKFVYFDGFIFEVGIYFEVFVAVLYKLFERDNITKLSAIEQYCNYCCSVTLIVIPEITCSRILRNSHSILASCASNINKTVCVLMALAIDSEVWVPYL